MDLLFTLLEQALLLSTILCVCLACWAYFYGHALHVPAFLVLAAVVLGAFTASCKLHEACLPGTFTQAEGFAR